MKGMEARQHIAPLPGGWMRTTGVVLWVLCLLITAFCMSAPDDHSLERMIGSVWGGLFTLWLGLTGSMLFVAGYIVDALYEPPHSSKDQQPPDSSTKQ